MEILERTAGVDIMGIKRHQLMDGLDTGSFRSLLGLLVRPTLAGPRGADQSRPHVLETPVLQTIAGKFNQISGIIHYLF